MFTQTFNKRKVVRLAQMVSHIVKKVGTSKLCLQYCKKRQVSPGGKRLSHAITFGNFICVKF